MIAIATLAGSSLKTSGAVPANPPRLAAAAPEKCPGVQKALRFYTKRWQHWTSLKQGAGTAHAVRTRPGTCPRYLLHVRKRKAAQAKRAWNRWFHYHYAWADWMPDKWQRIGACETGYGRRPGNFSWDSGTYVSFAGIIRGGYAQFARATGTPSWDAPGQRTPREQLIVASAIQARYGWSAWGCGNA